MPASEVLENSYEAFAEYYPVSDLDRSAEIAFYQGLAEGRRSILDLGCGPGTFAIPLAAKVLQAGGASARIVGIDLSDRMLDLARAKEPRVEWIRGDIRTPPVEGKFDLVVAPINILQALLTHADLLQALQSVRDRLEPKGVFAFDIYQPNWDFLGRPFEERPVRDFAAADGTALQVLETRTYDPQSRILVGDWRVVRAGDGQGETLAEQRVKLRQYSAEEIEAILTEAGLVLRERHGDFDRSPFTPASKKQIGICGLA